ncbi:MAG: hypothetical protein H0T78_02535 [Longispora sp.]|nr:hypothetical protein [Longispora sp. (in: high G+C Gram-positive bacteria)]
MNLGVAGWVLDTAPLLEFADGSSYARAVTSAARRHGLTLLVPIGALAEAYAIRRDSRQRQRLQPIRDEHEMWVLSLPSEVHAPDWERYATLADGDRTAGHVAVLAALRGWPIVTDRDQLFHRVIPGVQIVPA